MFGMTFSPLDSVMLLLAVVLTIYFLIAKNPHEPGSNEYTALRLFRVAFAFVFWSYGFGIIGLGLAIAAFVLSIVVMVKGDVGRGIAVMITLFVVRGIGFLDTAAWLASLQQAQ